MVRYIQEEMQKEEYGSLEEVWMPEDGLILEYGWTVEEFEKKNGRSNIYMSKEFRRKYN